jgi:hypothetical protein
MDSNKLCVAMASQTHRTLHMESVTIGLERLKIDSDTIRKFLQPLCSGAGSVMLVWTYIWATKEKYRLKRKSHFTGEELDNLQAVQTRKNGASGP